MERLEVTETFAGISLPGHLHTQESLGFATTFPFRPSDVLIATYPKSGEGPGGEKGPGGMGQGGSQGCEGSVGRDEDPQAGGGAWAGCAAQPPACQQDPELLAWPGGG